MQYETLVDLLRSRAEEQATNLAYTFMVDGKVPGKSLTYAQLDQEAQAIAVLLQQYNAKGERALLLYPQGLEFLAAFFGCLYAGVIAIPAPPPEASRLKRTLPRLQAIAKDAMAKFTLTTESILNLVEQQRKQIPEFKAMHWLTTERVEVNLAAFWRQSKLTGSDLAYLQYTSGSTSTPKGVMMSHHNLISNSELIRELLKYTESQASTTWMPYFHDYGLVEGLIQPMFSNIPSYMMSPIAFMKRPFNWLNIISTYNVTHTQAPNFAYQYCIEKISDDNLDKLDLSSLIVMSNGAEPIHQLTVENFIDKFTKCGFRRPAFHSAYGLAEATLVVSATSVAQPLKTKDGVVSCGRVLKQTKLLIVNPESLTECKAEEIGEIWVANESVAQGYWQNNIATRETFQAYTADTNQGPFLRTGDLGFIYQDELFVTGRLKDLIIVHGANYYPQDIEWTVEQAVTEVRNNQTAAFALTVDDNETLVIVAEVESKSINTKMVIRAIRNAIFDYYELNPYAVVLLKKGSILKTSSGKIQRQACKKAFLNHELEEIERDILPISDTEILVEPCSDMEIQMANLWADILDIPVANVGVKTSFFRYGGQSLLGVELIQRLNQELNLNLTPYILFEYQTIEELVNYLNKHSIISELTPITAQKLDYYPLSYLQQQIWLSCHQASHLPLYNEPVLIYLPGTIYRAPLYHSIESLLQRHSILRSNFTKRDSVPVQLILDNFNLSLEIIKVTDLATVLQLATKRAKQLFDLEEDLLFRATLFITENKDNILLLVVHHLLVDGLSLHQVLVPELQQTYQTLLDQQTPNLPNLPIQYADFAYWQRQQDYSTQKAYWIEQLRDVTVLQLADVNTWQNDYSGAVYHFDLSSNITKKLLALAKKYNITLFVTLISIFYILLYRYTNQNDLVIGTAVNQRNRSELIPLIGLFLNTLAMRVKLEPNWDFATLSQHVAKISTEAYNHQDIPFSEILAELRTKQGIQQLFQVNFVLEPEINDNSANWKCGLLDIHTDTSKFDLTLQFEQRDGKLVGRFEYNIHKFKLEFIARMAGHFKTLAASVITDPQQQAIAKLTLLTPVELSQFAAWNNTDVDFPRDTCIHQLFEQQASKTPNNIALIYLNQQLTYNELNQKANQLAHYLQEFGVKTESIVGVCMLRSMEMVIGILAILKAGGAYVPLDPMYPQARLNFMLEDTQLTVLLTQSNVVHDLSLSPNVKSISIDQFNYDSYASHNLHSIVNPNNLAYVIYTSGSTGKPKGTLLQHMGLCNLIMAQIKLFKLSHEEKVLQFSSLSFDAATSEIFMSLITGSSLSIVQQNNILVGRNLSDVLTEQNISIATIPPSVLGTINSSYIPNKLKTLIVAGEICPPELAKTWLNKVSNFINAYGPTEITVCATCSEPLKLINGYIPIGRAIANTKLYVLDQNQQRLPVGVVGELYIGGIGVARGYLNRPELNTTKFIPNPITQDEHDRLYRTGDLVRFLEDGQLEFIGRVDHQIKIRGFRVELEEIESILKQHGDIQDAVVVAEQGDNAEKLLVAYFIPSTAARRIQLDTTCQVSFDNGTTITLDADNVSCQGMGLSGLSASCRCQVGQIVNIDFELPDESHTKMHLTAHIAWINRQNMGVLFDKPGDVLCDYVEQRIRSNLEELRRNTANIVRKYLATKLPAHMIPSGFVMLDELPLTPNGKLDRQKLTASYQDLRLESDNFYIKPHNDVEQVVVEIWREVLQLERISLNTNFFDLGGTSLQIIKIQEMLEDKLNRQIPITSLFSYPNISALAQYLSDDPPPPEEELQELEAKVSQRKTSHKQRN
jgi:amino acid adenylation domain-containing protein